ncbi:hypothetical protein C8R47DRAFT_1324578 [Mycena vitilis]|nr:hypothetical protein C8R47DRAFT_1324578 [Mycena vitilis]
MSQAVVRRGLHPAKCGTAIDATACLLAICRFSPNLALTAEFLSDPEALRVLPFIRLQPARADFEERLKRVQADAAAEEERLKREQADAAAEEERLKRVQADAAAEEERLKRVQADEAAEEERLKREQSDAAAEEEHLKRVQAAAASVQTEEEGASGAKGEKSAPKKSGRKRKAETQLVPEGNAAVLDNGAASTRPKRSRKTPQEAADDLHRRVAAEIHAAGKPGWKMVAVPPVPVEEKAGKDKRAKSSRTVCWIWTTLSIDLVFTSRSSLASSNLWTAPGKRGTITNWAERDKTPFAVYELSRQAGR